MDSVRLEGMKPASELLDTAMVHDSGKPAKKFEKKSVKIPNRQNISRH